MPANPTIPRTDRYRGLDQTTHGLSGSPEHNVWSHLKRRCLNPKDAAYERYGGRGITIYEPWVDDFAAFYAHVGPRPTPQHTIERINNNGGYEPGNVKWDTRTAQARNRRSNRLVTYQGQTFCVAEWADITGMPMQRITQRLKRGWEPEQIFTIGAWPTKRVKKVFRRGDTEQNVRLTFDGRTECVAEWARLKGITASTLRVRLKRGWSVERALTANVRSKASHAAN